MKPEVFPDAETLAQHTADWLIGLAAAKQGRFVVSLSGGSTPKRLYQLLADSPRRERFPWDRTHFFWGDERFVPPDSPSSNWRMTREAMLDHVPVPTANVHPVPTTAMTHDQAAMAYERTLKDFYGNETLAPDRPLFDVMLLGLGTNGHTASLFPGMPVIEERKRWVGWMEDREAGVRITLTYPALESSAETAFLVAGADKQPMLKRLLAADPGIPAGRLNPGGRLHVFADRAAAGT
ncbi:MAG TPA: 6-phosphogluconolactonase [Reyranella sp.]|nr:6-phosphogluconolactonase [Reyranella sp.]